MLEHIMPRQPHIIGEASLALEEDPTGRPAAAVGRRGGANVVGRRGIPEGCTFETAAVTPLRPGKGEQKK